MHPPSFRNTRLKAFVAAVFLVASACTGVETPGVNRPDAQNKKDIVVVLHGLGRGEAAMWWLANQLEEVGYRSVRIEYRSLQDTPDEIVEDVSEQINQCCIGKSPNLHFVGHSLGGLLIRAYLSRYRPLNLGRVVLIGTPNAGSELVDNLRQMWWFPALGPTAQALGTDSNSFPNSLNPPDYSLGVIAGRKAGILNEEMLPGEDDGLVSVDSTKTDGMTDFVIVEAGHSALRYDRDVLRHVLSFLRTGRFAKDIK